MIKKLPIKSNQTSLKRSLTNPKLSYASAGPNIPRAKRKPIIETTALIGDGTRFHR